jgi:ketosteroid isomerase-like protein
VTSANVQAAQAIYGEWESNDYSSLEWAHPEIEYVTADGPVTGSGKGHAGVTEIFREFLSTWEDWRLEAESYHELPPDRVLVMFHFHARGKRSGLEITEAWSKGASLFRFQDGLVVSLTQYFNRASIPSELGLPL